MIFFRTAHTRHRFPLLTLEFWATIALPGDLRVRWRVVEKTVRVATGPHCIAQDGQARATLSMIPHESPKRQIKVGPDRVKSAGVRNVSPRYSSALEPHADTQTAQGKLIAVTQKPLAMWNEAPAIQVSAVRAAQIGHIQQDTLTPYTNVKP